MFRLAAERLLFLFLLVGSLPGFSLGQSLLWLDHVPPQDDQQRALNAKALALQPSGETRSPSAGTAIPAGTRVLMTLKSPLHTTSGTEGSGLYLETLYPVIQGNQIVIPAHSQVQGEVEINRRPGHLQRVAEFKFRFTSLIFPDNHVVAIDGALQSIPGSTNDRARRDGTVRVVDQTQKVVIPTAGGAATGALLGSVQRTGVGTFVGAGLGAGLGLVAVLLHRGDEISLPRGTNIEMVLQSPLVLEAEQAAFNAHYVPPPTPSADTKDARSDADDQQQRNRRRARPRQSFSGLPWFVP